MTRMTSRELAVWRSLFDTTAELRRLLGAQLAHDCGLSPGDYQVLLALSEAEGRRLRSSELAATIDWERSRLSHHLGRMERRVIGAGHTGPGIAAASNPAARSSARCCGAPSSSPPCPTR
jgi:hypothetical protein